MLDLLSMLELMKELWDGKAYARGINGHKLLLHPGINIDAELDKLNIGH